MPDHDIDVKGPVRIRRDTGNPEAVVAWPLLEELKHVPVSLDIPNGNHFELVRRGIDPDQIIGPKEPIALRHVTRGNALVDFRDCRGRIPAA